jgi:hypothetical protein
MLDEADSGSYTLDSVPIIDLNETKAAAFIGYLN